MTIKTELTRWATLGALIVGAGAIGAYKDSQRIYGTVTSEQYFESNQRPNYAIEFKEENGAEHYVQITGSDLEIRILEERITAGSEISVLSDNKGYSSATNVRICN